MSDLLFRSLVTLALGSLLALPLVSVREIGRGFFTLWVGIVATLVAAALLVHSRTVPVPGDSGAGVSGDALSRLLVLSVVLLGGFWIALRAGASRVATGVILASAVAGGLVLRELALTPSADDAAPVILRVTSLLLSALAVGLVTVAMVLGHWYLVQPKLALAPLRRMCDVLIGVLLARLIVTGWGFATSLGQGHRFLGGPEPIPWEILILSQRLLFGFGGSLILAVMIRKTVALRSTMSATGLLYIAILFVWVGEFLSIYLGRLTGGGLIV